MKKTKKALLVERILFKIAKHVLKKHNPKVVAITGSVGKTTTKEVVSKILGTEYVVRSSDKNYNNEIGVPLTILGEKSGGNSVIGWMRVFLSGIKQIYFSSDYPEILVLEMGMDRPGDMKYLCEMVGVDVGIITNVGISHLKYFKNKKEIAKEKSLLLKSLPVGGLAVINADDEECFALKNTLKSNIVTYGFSDRAELRASDFNMIYRKFQSRRLGQIDLLDGISFKISYKGKILPVKLTHGLSHSQVYAVLAALSAGQYFKINMIKAIEELADFYPPSGRQVRLEGIKNSVIIDDTYNSAPDSLKSALDVLHKAKVPKRKIAVLGDMLELGQEEDSSHLAVGKEVFDSGADYFIAVGDRMELAVKSFKKAGGGEDKVFWFDNPMEAGMFLQGIMSEGDLVLVKGSQGMRMEKVVEEVMAKPGIKDRVLVRQDEKWLQTEYKKP